MDLREGEEKRVRKRCDLVKPSRMSRGNKDVQHGPAGGGREGGLEACSGGCAAWDLHKGLGGGGVGGICAYSGDMCL